MYAVRYETVLMLISRKNNEDINNLAKLLNKGISLRIQNSGEMFIKIWKSIPSNIFPLRIIFSAYINLENRHTLFFPLQQSQRVFSLKINR